MQFYKLVNMEKLKEHWLELVCYLIVAVLGIRIIIHVINNPELFSVYTS